MKRIDKLCEMRSKRHEKIKKIISKALLCKTTLCNFDKTSQVYADIEYQFRKDYTLHREQEMLLEKRVNNLKGEKY